MKPTVKILLTRGVEEVIVKKHLEKLLQSKKKLRVKFGIDPTAPDLHLGHAVVLRKLRQFQDAGHKAILIIGDFTAKISDPSGRSAMRRPLDDKEIRKNLKEYLAHAGKIINLKKTEIDYNNKWFKNKKALEIILDLAKASSVSQALHRADFKKRLSGNGDVSILEMLYPLFQGYDSVAIKADMELGGTDQKFNLLMGRQVQQCFNMPPQDILMMPLLEGTDGAKKMSKSYGNYIAIDEKPDEMFGKIMSIPDNLMPKYFETLTYIDIAASKIKKDPRGAKLLLAKTIVSNLHSKSAGVKAEKNFIKTFSKKETPTDIPSLRGAKRRGNLSLIDLLLKAGIPSKTEARRLVKQGGVKIDSNVIKSFDEKIDIKKGSVLKIGKKRFFRLS
ncbi:MAG: tyrosine--tRNA ligase [Patescibacteria group bacterium]